MGNTFDLDALFADKEIKARNRVVRLCAFLTKAACSCRVGGCYNYRADCGSRNDIPRVDHDGRQALLYYVIILIIAIFIRHE